MEDLSFNPPTTEERPHDETTPVRNVELRLQRGAVRRHGHRAGRLLGPRGAPEPVGQRAARHGPRLPRSAARPLHRDLGAGGHDGGRRRGPRRHGRVGHRPPVPALRRAVPRARGRRHPRLRGHRVHRLGRRARALRLPVARLHRRQRAGERDHRLRGSRRRPAGIPVRLRRREHASTRRSPTTGSATPGTGAWTPNATEASTPSPAPP